ncbi:MAG: DUF2179 domain-containing protein [Firmicutes bacterium]|nr:DUF2179 domain-containing protein [Bacillota bacterium]
MELLFLCIKVFFVRITDVTMGTFRTILTVKAKPIQASMIGFIEVLIWFLVVKEALNTDSNSIFVAIAYAGGFATGTFLGGKLSQKFISGNSSLQVITKNKKIIDVISGSGYGVTVIDAKGYNDAKKYMLLIEVNNKNIGDVKNIIKKLDKQAFIIITETKLVQNGYIK